MNTETQNADATKLCRICGEPIKLRALKCKECGSWQDWRGAMGLSSEVLALLIALVSVVGSFFPVIFDALMPTHNALRFSFQSATNKTVSMLVWNEGRKPASISQIQITVLTGQNGPGETGAYVNILRPVGTGGALAVPTGADGISITFYTDSAFGFSERQLQTILPRAKCSLNLSYSDFDGRPESQWADADCDRLAIYLYSRVSVNTPVAH